MLGAQLDISNNEIVLITQILFLYMVKIQLRVVVTHWLVNFDTSEAHATFDHAELIPSGI